MLDPALQDKTAGKVLYWGEVSTDRASISRANWQNYCHFQKKKIKIALLA